VAAFFVTVAARLSLLIVEFLQLPWLVSPSVRLSVDLSVQLGPNFVDDCEARLLGLVSH